ncbi:RHNO1 protein, partial [Nycticryphes semicollaris]|nr:RHNO1 protein [Nycticryphes semicollaris]
MPPKKKCTHKATKAELVFLERPREGPVHCYETPVTSAGNPRRVPTKRIDQNTSAAWVCPQFETTKSVALEACQRKHCGPYKHQNQDASNSCLHARGACPRACKYPPLTLENPEGYAVHPSDSTNCSKKSTQHSCSRPKKGMAAKANIQVKSPENSRVQMPLLSAPQPVDPEVFSSQDVATPQMPSIRNWRFNSTPPQRNSHAWHLDKDLAFSIDPCGKGESAAVLVTDTPEHEYGVKVTWRRRPHLMKYLQKRG